jgi:hypothetical protein
MFNGSTAASKSGGNVPIQILLSIMACFEPVGNLCKTQIVVAAGRQTAAFFQ